MNEKHYHLICLGGGSGGIATAKRAAEHGANVLVIESGRLGGTCVNVGCVPKKISWHVAQLAENIKLSKQYGFSDTPAHFDWEFFVGKRNAFINKLNRLYANGLENSGVDVIRGEARFVDNYTVEVNGEQFTANHIVIAVGGKPFIPDVSGANYGRTSNDFFEMTELPQSIAVVGAGYIAVELAGVLNALGVETHLIVRGSQLLKFVDSDIAGQLASQMVYDGVDIHFNEEISSLKFRSHIVAKFKSGESLSVDKVIWATGRVANIDDIGLENTDVIVQDNGKIAVDYQQNTDAPQIYAIGDITDQPELTPAAIEAGRQLAERLFNDQNQAKADFTFVPTVIFSHPPIGTVGMSEAQANVFHGSDNIKVYRSTFNPLLRSMTDDKVPTVMKMICLKNDDERVIGLHVIGDFADEIIQGFAVAVQMGATKVDFDKTLAIHPTSGEEFVTMR